jgi:hypothetical protein
VSAAAQLVREALRDPEVRAEVLAILRDALPTNDAGTEPLIDAREAAKILDMTVPAVRAAAYRGSVPCQRVGRLLRFRRSDLLRRRP